MEKFVDRIIETDRKAREIIEQAQQEKQAVLADAKKRADAEIARRETEADKGRAAIDEEFAQREASVIEVTAALQSHPYFKDSLKGLSQTNLHRAQIEEALSKDVYYKYESLMRYSFRKGKFGAYFLMRSEINELLAKLRLLSMGFRHHYIIQVPGFLMPKTSFSLLRLAKAESAQDCLEVVAGTPYAKVLAGVLPAAGQKLDYLKCEHAFQSYFYTTVLAQIDRDLSGRSAADTKRLFRMEAEIYNLDLLFRAKAFFSPQLTPEDLKKLLIPVYGVLSAKNMNALADTRGLDEFLKLYNAGRAGQVYGARSADPADASEVSETRALYRAAQKLLHFSSTPQTVLAALLCLANLERSNIINVIEGVRYGLSPEQISAFLKY